MFCPKCGAKNADGARFCLKCGAPLYGQAAPTQAQPAQPMNPAMQQPAYAGMPGQQMPVAAVPAAGKGFKRPPVPVLAGIAAAVVVVLVAIFLVIPAITSSNGVLGKVMSQDSNALSSAVTSNVQGQPVFFSNADASKLVQDKVSAYSSSSSSNPFQLTDAEVNTLNGQWALMNISSSGGLSASTTGMAAYVTVTKDTSYSAKDLAGAIRSSGVKVDHVVAAKANSDLVQKFLGSYSSYYQAMTPQSACMAISESKDEPAIAVSLTYSNYTIVAIFSGSPSAISQTSSSMQQFQQYYDAIVSDLYVS